MNLKNFFKRWIKGMKELTPVQQLKAKCIGIVGCTIGLILALIVMIIRKVWYIIIVMFFLIFLQIIQYIGTWQQLKQTQEILKEVEYTNQDIESAKLDKELGNAK